MTKLYGSEWKRNALLRRVGDVSQLGGIRRAKLLEGYEEGVEVLDFRVGTGLAFTVVPSRGMSIAHAEYRGVPLAWISPSTIVGSAHTSSEGMGWLDGFFGGLLTTCGLTNVGVPDEDDGEALGLHGRIANIPARHVSIDHRWEGNSLFLSAQGRMREHVPNRYTLELTRNISVKVGENRIFIADIVENVGFTDAPFMFLYHINVGFPVLDEGSELLCAAADTRPRDKTAEDGLLDRFRFTAPIAGFEEQVFYHEMIEDKNRHVWVALVNRDFNGGEGIGLYVKYHKSQFPNFVEWKMMSEGTYVVGLEPANCHVEGRTKERENGTLAYIEAGGRRHFETEIGVLTGREEIDAFEERVVRIRDEAAGLCG